MLPQSYAVLAAPRVATLQAPARLLREDGEREVPEGRLELRVRVRFGRVLARRGEQGWAWILPDPGHVLDAHKGASLGRAGVHWALLGVGGEARSAAAGAAAAAAATQEAGAGLRRGLSDGELQPHDARGGATTGRRVVVVNYRVTPDLPV